MTACMVDSHIANFPTISITHPTVRGLSCTPKSWGKRVFTTIVHIASVTGAMGTSTLGTNLDLSRVLGWICQSSTYLLELLPLLSISVLLKSSTSCSHCSTTPPYSCSPLNMSNSLRQKIGFHMSSHSPNNSQNTMSSQNTWDFSPWMSKSSLLPAQFLWQ